MTYHDDWFEFEVRCWKCGETNWIYGSQEEQDSYNTAGYLCGECWDKQEEETNHKEKK